MVPLIAAAGTLLVSGGGFYFLLRTGDTVEAVSSNLLEFLNNKVWPIMLSTLHILRALLLILIISYCDAFLRSGPRTNSESLLVNGVYYISWMCTLYFILKVLLDDILRVKAKTDGFIIIVVPIFGVLFPVWEAFGGNVVQTFSNLIYFIICSVIIIIVLLLAIKHCKVPN